MHYFALQVNPFVVQPISTVLVHLTRYIYITATPIDGCRGHQRGPQEAGSSYRRQGIAEPHLAPFSPCMARTARAGYCCVSPRRHVIPHTYVRRAVLFRGFPSSIIHPLENIPKGAMTWLQSRMKILTGQLGCVVRNVATRSWFRLKKVVIVFAVLIVGITTKAWWQAKGGVTMRNHTLLCDVDGLVFLTSLEWAKYRSIVQGFCKCPCCNRYVEEVED
jgi:hypothetical protein